MVLTCVEIDNNWLMVGTCILEQGTLYQNKIAFWYFSGIFYPHTAQK